MTTGEDATGWGGRKALFLDLVATLEREGIRYCLLGATAEYPEVIPSDVDLMVLPDDLPRIPGIVADLAIRNGVTLMQATRHSLSAVCLVLARREVDQLSFFQIDSTTDYYAAGKPWLSAEDVVARRQKCGGGFFVPAPPDAFAYYFLKKIVEKSELCEMHGKSLTGFFRGDADGCRALLEPLLGADDAAFVAAAAETGNWAGVGARCTELRSRILVRSGRPALSVAMRQASAWISMVTSRVFHRTGICIAFLGPDGSGKSTVIGGVQASVRHAFARVRYQHLKPALRADGARGKAAATVTDPHGKPQRGIIGSAAKLLQFWIIYVLGMTFRIRPMLIRSTLVVFDRYYYDIEADPRRYRYGGPAWLAHFVGRCLPCPDLVFVLDAPPEVVRARKAEVSMEESRRQRQAYADVCARTANARLVDASQPVPVVVGDVLDAIVRFMAWRTARRLGLVSAT